MPRGFVDCEKGNFDCHSESRRGGMRNPSTSSIWAMNKLSIRDLELGGKRVFVRVDFNVPLDGGHVTDDTRIGETLPTVAFARERGARLVLASHLGRPKGKPDPKYSLLPVAAKLAELLRAPVEFVADCVGADAE